MTILERFDKIEALKTAGETTFSFEKLERVQVDTDYEAVLINDWVIIPIQVASFYDRNLQWIDLKKEDETFLGYLYLTNKIKLEDSINALALEELLQIMHIYEHQSLNEILQQDYLLIQENNFSEYVTKFYNSAPLWGNFFHLNKDISLPKAIAKNEIIAISNLSLNQTTYHQSAAIRAIQQPFVFERFLKKYHLLELLFDYQFVKGLFNKNIDTELKDIVGLVQTYGKGTYISRLTAIVKEYCTNFSKLENVLSNLRNYPNQIENILFKYGKESNPVDEDFNVFYSVVNQANGFVLEEIKGLKKITQIKVESSNIKYAEQQANQQLSYQKFLHEFTAYCIYRIRSSVAHHKVGEYVITNSDEDFMIYFAEPLIDGVLIQCFQSTPTT